MNTHCANFALLQKQWPDLYDHAERAEFLVWMDAATAAVKLRCFAEAMVGFLYQELGLLDESGGDLFERLKAERFETLVDQSVLKKLHTIRMLGNKAAHGKTIEQEQALHLLQEAYLLGRWLYATYAQEQEEEYPEFESPVSLQDKTDALQLTNEQLQQQLEEAKKDLAAQQVAVHKGQGNVVPISEARLNRFRIASAHAALGLPSLAQTQQRSFTLEDAFAGYTLTPGQSELVKRLDDFLGAKNDNVFLLKGYAGTGKTFITKGLTDYLKAVGRTHMLAAPTGKAAKVLASNTGLQASTIHSAIYRLDGFDTYSDEAWAGDEVLEVCARLCPSKYPGDAVYIIDEASMVSDMNSETEAFRFGSGQLLKDFLQYIDFSKNTDSKLIFIGDDAQLPPIGMALSPALDEVYLAQKYGLQTAQYELDEVVRQKAESGIIQNAVEIREALASEVFNKLYFDFSCADVHQVQQSDLVETYLECCDYRVSNDAVVIAYSNADVATFNRDIRSRFFPGVQQLCAGDKIMAISNSYFYGFPITNGEFGIVKSVLGEAEHRSVVIKRKNKDSGEVERITVPLAFRDVIVGFRDLSGSAHFFQAKIVEHILYSDMPTLSSDERKALYLDFVLRNGNLAVGSDAFKDALQADPYFNALHIKFGYAITCHKAQGSEWKHVLVKCNSHQKQLSSGYFRWIYTAITRASEKLWLLNPPQIKVGSGLKSVLNPMAGLYESEPVVAASHPMKEQKPAVAAVPLKASDFGIPEGAAFLVAVFESVCQKVVPEGIAVESIVHNNYQEVYTFRRENDFARVDLSYNSKNKVTRIGAPIPSDLATEITGCLASLVGLPLGVQGTGADITFSESFINELHERLAPMVSDAGIGIASADQYQWHVRYRFTRLSEVAVIDIFFNGKKQFTKYQPVVTACSPGTLLSDVERLLTEGLQS